MNIKNDALLFQKILLQNVKIKEILERTGSLNLPNWYLGAGCISQTIWNYLHGYNLNKNIFDYDLVYFDESDLSYEAENRAIELCKSEFKDLQIKLDIKNQARVHCWYKDHFGYQINPYKDIYKAIESWPTTATSIGIKTENEEFQYFAPFGLDDIYNMIVRPNKIQITREIYEKKVERWKKCWPKLKIIEW